MSKTAQVFVEGVVRDRAALVAQMLPPDDGDQGGGQVLDVDRIAAIERRLAEADTLAESFAHGIAHMQHVRKTAGASAEHIEAAFRATDDAESAAVVLAEHGREMVQVFDQLSVQARDIGAIVASIQEVGKRTALNAAIEAVRAGEAGRGFAVVSDEVRDLSERANASSDQIAAITRALPARTNEASRGIDVAMAGVDKILSSTRTVAAAIGEVRAGASQRGELVRTTEHLMQCQQRQCVAICRHRRSGQGSDRSARRGTVALMQATWDPAG